MKRAAPFLFGLVLSIPAVAFAAASPAPATADLKSLVEAERAFSRLSADKGLRTAFLANLAPDAIVFRPLPVSGRKAYEESPEVAAKLTWRPTFAEISRAGDFGYTTGPYELVSDRPGSAAQYGHFVSVWRIQPDGSWKVVVDAGSVHPRPAIHAPDLKFDEVWLPTPPPAAPDPGAVRSALLAVDWALSAAAAKTGMPEVLTAVYAEDVRVYRPNLEPIVGRAAAEKAAVGPAGKWTWTPMDGGIAASADLGYTYGTLDAGGRSFCYFRIWKKAGEAWNVALDLLSPVAVKPGA